MLKKIVAIGILSIFIFLCGCNHQYGDYILKNEGINNDVTSYDVIDGKLTYVFNQKNGRSLYHDGKISSVYRNVYLDTVAYLDDGSVFFIAENRDRDKFFVFENIEYQEKYGYFKEIIPIEGNIIGIIDKDNQEEYLYNFKKTNLSLNELRAKAKKESKVQNYDLENYNCSIINEFDTNIVDYENPGFYLSCDGERVSKNYAYINKESILKHNNKYAFSVQTKLNSYLVVYDNTEIGRDLMSNKGGITPDLISYDNKIYFNCCGELYSIIDNK